MGFTFHGASTNILACIIVFFGAIFNTEHEEFVFFLPQIKFFVALVPSIHDACFSMRNNLIDKGPFRPIAIDKKYFSRKY
jgi:hypothetical protein